MWDKIWDILGKASALLGLISIPTMIWGCVAYVRDKNIARRRHQAILKGTGSSAAVLVVTVGQASVGSAVKRYIDTDAGIREALGISSSAELTPDQFIEIKMENKIDFRKQGNDCIKKLDRALNKPCRRLKEQGVDRVYFFYCGLSVLAAKVGARLSNRHTVLLYQYAPDTEQKYHYAGSIQ